ncbi:Hydrophobin [Ceraceosorus bombacis]|uniref:Hydrophobin n=1 Tax=Ceraceosorus bombacis TaxID=401625 RepID=A0A0P1BSV9_9BASI|nr:Hydrophobin [Ceraceosorus bombacis]
MQLLRLSPLIVAAALAVATSPAEAQGNPITSITNVASIPQAALNYIADQTGINLLAQKVHSDAEAVDGAVRGAMPNEVTSGAKRLQKLPSRLQRKAGDAKSQVESFGKEANSRITNLVKDAQKDLTGKQKAAAAEPNPEPRPASNVAAAQPNGNGGNSGSGDIIQASGPCSQGKAQCCDQTLSGDKADTLISALGVQQVLGDVGINCVNLPINVIGGAASLTNTCKNTPVCCQNVTQNGLINLGCSALPIN